MKLLRNIIFLTIVIELAVIFISCKRAAADGNDQDLKVKQADFIYRNGTQLLYKGKPFRFTGYNANYFFGCGFPGSRIEGPDVHTFFQQYTGAGNVIRVWVLPGTNLSTLDNVILEAKAKGVFITAALSDHLGQCGDKEGRKDTTWYKSGYKATYLPWVKQVVSRYKDEPTIAFWEFLNEPQGKNVVPIRAFMDSVGAIIKGIDPNHLICSGTMPAYAYDANPRNATEWQYINACPYVDITCIHEYDMIAARSPHLNFVLQATINLNKPIVIGEYGINSSPGGSGCLTDFAARAKMVKAKLDDYFSVPQVCGAMLWMYQWGTHTNCSLGTDPSDTSLYKVIPHYPL